jgi:hypothetical protein
MEETNVVISVSGGNVNGVFTNNPRAHVYLVDYDNIAADPLEDCSESFPTGTIKEFHSVVKKDVRSFQGIARLQAVLGRPTG